MNRLVSASSFGLFRLLFGLLLVYQSFFVFKKEYIQENFVDHLYHFPHHLFYWLNLPELNSQVIYILFLMIGLAGLGIAFGIFYRFSCFLFLGAFGYIFLLEKALYFDHYYLMLCLVFLLCLMPYPSWPPTRSIPCINHRNTHVPWWCYLALRTQFICVYVFAGLAKLNERWLFKAEPMQSILADKGIHDIGAAYVFSWMGCFIDLFLPILFIWGKHKKITFCLLCVFHMGNIWLFEGDINTFPFLMLIGYILFLKPETPEKWFSSKNLEKPRSKRLGNLYRMTQFLVILFLLVQLFLPLRSWLYPQEPSWTMEGARFTWRLKMNTKKVKMRVLVKEKGLAREEYLVYQEFLTPYQQWIDNMPDALVQFAHYVKEDYEELGWQDPGVFIYSQAHLPGYTWQTYIDETQDLSRIPYPYLKPASWIEPLKH